MHLASSFLTDDDLCTLSGLYDVLHTPRHSTDAYYNFELFTIRDINRLAIAPWFIKLDADIELQDDWIDYVEECIEAHPDAVLFGPRRGNVDVTFDISAEIRVTNGVKVIGGFYVGRTAFFKANQRFMDDIHMLMSRNGSGRFRGNEDTLRSLVVHAAGAGDKLHVFDSGGRVRIFRPGVDNA